MNQDQNNQPPNNTQTNLIFSISNTNNTSSSHNNTVKLVNLSKEEIISDIFQNLQNSFTLINNNQRKLCEIRLEKLRPQIFTYFSEILENLVSGIINPSLILSVFVYLKQTIFESLRKNKIDLDCLIEIIRKYLIVLFKCNLSSNINENIIQTLKHIFDYPNISRNAEISKEIIIEISNNVDAAMKETNLTLLKTSLLLIETFISSGSVNNNNWKFMFDAFFGKLMIIQNELTMFIISNYNIALFSISKKYLYNNNCNNTSGIDVTPKPQIIDVIFYINNVDCLNVLYQVFRVLLFKLRSRLQKLNYVLSDIIKLIPLANQYVMCSLTSSPEFTDLWNFLQFNEILKTSNDSMKLLLNCQNREKQLSLIYSCSGIEQFDICINKSKVLVLQFINSLLLNFTESNIKKYCNLTDFVNSNLNDNNSNNVNKTSTLDYDSIQIDKQNIDYFSNTNFTNPYLEFTANSEILKTNYDLLMKIFNDTKILINSSFYYIVNMSSTDKDNQFDYYFYQFIFEALALTTKLIFLPTYSNHFSNCIREILTDIIFPLTITRTEELSLLEENGEEYFNQLIDLFESTSSKTLKAACSYFIKQSISHFNGVFKFFFNFIIEIYVMNSFLRDHKNNIGSLPIDEINIDDSIKAELRIMNNYLSFILKTDVRILSINSSLFQILSLTSIHETSLLILSLMSSSIVVSNDALNTLKTLISDYLPKILQQKDEKNTIVFDRLCIFISLLGQHLYPTDSKNMALLIEVVLTCLLKLKAPGLIQTSSHTLKQLFSSIEITHHMETIDKYLNFMIAKISDTYSCLFLDAFYNIVFKLKNANYTIRIIQACVERVIAETSLQPNRKFKLFTVIDGKTKQEKKNTSSKKNQFFINKLLNIIRLLVTQNVSDFNTHELELLESKLLDLVKCFNFIEEIEFDEDIIDIANQLLKSSCKITAIQNIVIENCDKYVRKTRGLALDLFQYLNNLIVNCSFEIASNPLYQEKLFSVFIDSQNETNEIEYSNFYGINLMIILVTHCKELSCEYLYKMLSFASKNIICVIPMHPNDVGNYFNNSNEKKKYDHFKPDIFGDTVTITEPFYFEALISFIFSCFINYTSLTSKYLLNMKNDSFDNYDLARNQNNLHIDSYMHINSNQELNLNRMSFNILLYSLQIITERKQFFNNYLYKLVILGICKIITESEQSTFNHSLVDKFLSCCINMLNLQKTEETAALKKGMSVENVLLGKKMKPNYPHSNNNNNHKNNINKEIKLDQFDEVSLSNESNSRKDSSESEDSNEEEHEKNLLFKHSIKQMLKKELSKNEKNEILDYESFGKTTDIMEDMNTNYQADKEHAIIFVKSIISNYKNFDEFSFFKKALKHLIEFNKVFLDHFINSLNEKDKEVFKNICKTTRIKILDFCGSENNNSINNINSNVNSIMGSSNKNYCEDSEVVTIPRRIVKLKKKSSIMFDLNSNTNIN